MEFSFDIVSIYISIHFMNHAYSSMLVKNVSPRPVVFTILGPYACYITSAVACHCFYVYSGIR